MDDKKKYDSQLKHLRSKYVRFLSIFVLINLKSLSGFVNLTH